MKRQFDNLGFHNNIMLSYAITYILFEMISENVSVEELEEN